MTILWTPNFNKLRQKLESLSNELGLTRRGQLKPEVRKAVAGKAKKELMWLNQKYGVDLMDDKSLYEDTYQGDAKFKTIEDICEVDQEAKRQLKWALIMSALK